MLDGRQLSAQLLAFDKHMNLVLADTQEFRTKRKQTKSGAPGASASQTIEQEEKRTLGLTIVRGAHIVSLSVESPPPADPSTRLGKPTAGGITSTLGAGPGVARPAGRGAPPIALAGPAPGVGGAAPPPAFPGFPGGAPPPGFPGRGGRKFFVSSHIPLFSTQKEEYMLTWCKQRLLPASPEDSLLLDSPATRRSLPQGSRRVVLPLLDSTRRRGGKGLGVRIGCNGSCS